MTYTGIDYSYCWLRKLRICVAGMCTLLAPILCEIERVSLNWGSFGEAVQLSVTLNQSDKFCFIGPVIQ